MPESPPYPPRRAHRTAAFLSLLLAVGAPALTPDAAAQERSFVDTVRDSGFIFVGTVEAVGESTASIPKRPDGAVVRVDRVIEALPPVGDPTGQRVTVRLRNPDASRSGETSTFFTYVQSAGETLELIEVARAEPEPEAIAERVAAARGELADRALAERLESARAVVIGKVAETEPAKEAGPPESEHDPLWWRARIEVERVVTGQVSNDRPLEVYFATNFDYRWAEAPRLSEGERAILLLQGDPEPDDRVDGFFLLHPLDKLPVDELGRVRALLGGR